MEPSKNSSTNPHNGSSYAAASKDMIDAVIMPKNRQLPAAAA
jgi:hypothetical protein